MTRAIACRLCGAPSRFWFTAEGRDVYRCGACRHIEVPEGLARLADGRSIYESEDAVFTADGNADYYVDETNQLAARAKLDFVSRWCSAGTLIDVGASYGHFLSVASTRFDACGFEISPDAVEFSRREFGARNQIGSIYDWPAALAAPADVITCWDVIEHVEDPSRAIAIMVDHLKPAGWLFLSTPDAGSLVARLMGSRWHYLDPVQHINVFSRRNLVGLLRRHSLSVRHARTFGRRYRVSYIVNRLAYLHREGRLRGVAKALGALSTPVHRLKVPITLGDVMGLAAQRESPHDRE
jgi:SAM-dependent methyltransferase